MRLHQPPRISQRALSFDVIVFDAPRKASPSRWWHAWHRRCPGERVNIDGGMHGIDDAPGESLDVTVSVMRSASPMHRSGGFPSLGCVLGHGCDAWIILARRMRSQLRGMTRDGRQVPEAQPHNFPRSKFTDGP